MDDPESQTVNAHAADNDGRGRPQEGRTDRGRPAKAEHLKPERMPPLSRQAWNLATSLASFVADGMRTVSKQQYQERLEICDACGRRRGNRCLVCGCRLSLKARGRAFRCPVQKWPEV